MLADQLDYVVGVDPHRDLHALAVVHVLSGAVVFEATVAASSDGYAQALRLVERARAWSACVRGRRDRLVRCGSDAVPDRPRRAGARGRPAAPRASLGRQDRCARRDPRRSQRARPGAAGDAAGGGEREALQALMAAREGAVNAKRAGLCQLRDLLVTTPEPLRSELRPLTRARLLQRLAATRPERRRDPELRGTLARAALDRPTRPAADRRGTRARTRDRDAHPQARTATARPARRRSARRRAARALLVTPRPHQLRSRVRTTRRRRPDPGLLGADSPLPPRPKRRPQTQPRAAHDPRHPKTLHPRRSPTSNDASRKARPDAKQTAASSATSPAASTAYSNTDRQRRLDKHRSIARPGAVL